MLTIMIANIQYIVDLDSNVDIHRRILNVQTIYV